MYKDIRLNEIKISDDFASKKPSKKKYAQRWNEFEEGTLFLCREIVVDENNNLIDGYITYLVLKDARYNGDIQVKVRKPNGKSYANQKTMYVFGKHTPDGKELVWRLPNRLRGKEPNIKVGDSVKVHTKYGINKVTVTRVEMLEKSPVFCKVKELAAW